MTRATRSAGDLPDGAVRSLIIYKEFRPGDAAAPHRRSTRCGKYVLAKLSHMGERRYNEV